MGKRTQRDWEEEQERGQDRERKEAACWVCVDCGEEFRKKVHSCPFCGCKTFEKVNR